MQRVQLKNKRTEQLLEKELESLIKTAIGQEPAELTCTFVNRSEFTVVIKGIRTPAELLLLRSGKEKTAQRLRSSIHKIIAARVRCIVEKISNNRVSEVFVSRQTHTSWLGIFLILRLSNRRSADSL